MDHKRRRRVTGSTTSQLRGTGFSRVDYEPKKRLVISVAAKEKEGKTHFLLTAPGPIALQSTDIGHDGVVQKFMSKKEIYESSYRYSGGRGAKRQFPKFNADFEAAKLNRCAVVLWQ